jgi:hypothetical protein
MCATKCFLLAIILVNKDGDRSKIEEIEEIEKSNAILEIIFARRSQKM